MLIVKENSYLFILKQYKCVTIAILPTPHHTTIIDGCPCEWAGTLRTIDCIRRILSVYLGLPCHHTLGTWQMLTSPHNCAACLLTDNYSCTQLFLRFGFSKQGYCSAGTCAKKRKSNAYKQQTLLKIATRFQTAELDMNYQFPLDNFGHIRAGSIL